MIRLSLPLAAAIALAGCGTSGVALPQRCTNVEHGLTISYPGGWHTNSGEVIAACSAFDPAPIEMPRDSEIPYEIAVVIDVEQIPFERTAQSTMWERIVSAEQQTIAGRDALRVEAEATGEGLAERGMRSLRYTIDLGSGRTLIASTHDAAPSYEENKSILDGMVRSITWAQ